MLAGKIVGAKAGNVAAAQAHNVWELKEKAPKPSCYPAGRAEKSKHHMRTQAVNLPQTQNGRGQHE